MYSNEIYYYSNNVPKYFKTDLARFGYKFLDIESTFSEVNLIEKNLNLIWNENEIKKLIDHIDIINISKQKNVLVISQPFLYHQQIIKLNNLIKNNNIVILSTQEIKNLYSNIKCYAINSSELWCHHDFIYYLVKKWHKNRKPKEDALFLFLTALKNDTTADQRSEAIKEVYEKVGNDILPLSIETASSLYKKRDEFNMWMEGTFNKSNMLGGFGNGTPRFDLYDKVFAEIVIETVYYTPTIHLTEKTWRPIACGIPCILLLNSANIEQLRLLGYDLYPKILYDELSGCTEIKQASQLLLDFSIKLKKDDKLRMGLKETAIKNYKKFWEVKSYWEAGIEGVRNTFGFCPTDEIEERLKKI